MAWFCRAYPHLSNIRIFPSVLLLTLEIQNLPGGRQVQNWRFINFFIPLNYIFYFKKLGFYCFNFLLDQKVTKSRKFGKGCQEISPKLRFCFLPETETSLFRKFEFVNCVFLAHVHQHKTESCFVSKFPEGQSSPDFDNASP